MMFRVRSCALALVGGFLLAGCGARATRSASGTTDSTVPDSSMLDAKDSASAVPDACAVPAPALDAGSFLAGLPTCPEIPNLNSGAAVGPLTIGGYVKDSAGTRIIGARVDLSGSAEAVRFTDFSGGYVFHVCPGSYTLRAAGDCTLDPTSVNLDNLTVNAAQDFTGSGMSCVTGTPFSVGATGELIQVWQAGTALGLTGTSMLQGSSSRRPQTAPWSFPEILRSRVKCS